MTPEQFAYWLNGYAELSGGVPPTQDQWDSIVEHLNLVFNKVTKPVPKVTPKVAPVVTPKGFNEILKDHFEKQRATPGPAHDPAPRWPVYPQFPGVTPLWPQPINVNPPFDPNAGKFILTC